MIRIYKIHFTKHEYYLAEIYLRIWMNQLMRMLTYED